MSNDQNVTRKLIAILSADVKGYSILMADDEVFTIKMIKEYTPQTRPFLNILNWRKPIR